MERTIIIEYGVRGMETLQRKTFTAGPSDKFGYRVDSDKERGCLVVFVNDRTFIIPLMNLALLEMNL